MKKHVEIHVTGCVQGVGFRPTVYRHAMEFGLSGSVRNDARGVIIDVAGDEAQIAAFVTRLRQAPPPQARIDEITSRTLSTPGDSELFTIAASTRSGDVAVGMPPDLTACGNCVREMHDPGDRRYGYPFLNCTDCGPRFTIIKKLPYDRERTSMADFVMCPDCREEYESQADRRFDAQPNACPKCGPCLRLIDSDQQVLDGDPLETTVKLLREGFIVAVKGLGGFHLACLATDADAIQRLRNRKKRPDKALAVMFREISQIRQHYRVTEPEEAELQSVAHPIVIVQRRHNCGLPSLLSPDTLDIGAFLPYTPLHHLLLDRVSPLVMTSANLAEEPIAHTLEHLRPLLGTVADFVLDHNRDIVRCCDDSVVRMVGATRLFMRRSRGFVPTGLRLPVSGPAVVACGADLKNTFCVSREDYAYPSQHIGDLLDAGSHRLFDTAAPDFCQLLEVTPHYLAHDMHPGYVSTRLAKHFPNAARVAVQHHHAHIAACMAENGVTEPVIGIALDGTGYGPDGTVWGGEFLVADLCDFTRLAHFRQYRMPGGEAAIREPARMALSVLLREGLIDEASNLDSIPGVRAIPAGERAILAQLIRRGTAAPLTSSAGRFFDAVSALLGCCETAVSYEGQAAIRLQAAADTRVHSRYPYEIQEHEVSFAPMLAALLADARTGVDTPRLAAMFHNTVADAAVEMCSRIRASHGISTVALSGGVFQNDLLLSLVTDGLRDRGFRILIHQRVSPNDSGISLGQAAVALARHGS